MENTKKNEVNEVKNEAQKVEAQKKELLELARSGAPRPEEGTELGDALTAFTTKPEVPEVKDAWVLNKIQELLLENGYLDVRTEDCCFLTLGGIKHYLDNSTGEFIQDWLYGADCPCTTVDEVEALSA
jgi:hypothetical protein